MSSSGTARPNVLLFIPDGMQAGVTEPGSSCQTPHFDWLAARGVRCSRAYTTNPTCSPARSSLMTGRLPHNHGVLQVEHATDRDQNQLRRELPHWAQRLREAGYRTGYFGKWHIEPEEDLSFFGWEVNGSDAQAAFRNIGSGDESVESLLEDAPLTRFEKMPSGYNPVLHYGVTRVASEDRAFARTTDAALQYVREASRRSQPWVCCVSFSEPNVPLIAGEEAFRAHRSQVTLPDNRKDSMKDKPTLYRRAQRVYDSLEEEDWKDCQAVYQGLVHELDQQFGRLLEAVDLDNTIVLILSDHGRYVAGHGMDHHNFGAFDEIYRIPLILAGPGIAQGKELAEPVSILDLYPSLLEWAGLSPKETLDGSSLCSLLADPKKGNGRSVYAENFGTRFTLTQRVYWEGPWKLVFNGFDEDELYDLDKDPGEMNNLAGFPEYQERYRQLMKKVWKKIHDSQDRALMGTHYQPMRMGIVGPNEES